MIVTRGSIVLVSAALAVSACARTGLFGDMPTDTDPADVRPFDVGDDVPPDAPLPDIPPDVPLPDAPDSPDIPDLPDVPPSVCGDGIVAPDEACDDGPDNSDVAPDACRTDCTLPRCGDGVVDQGEPCDDGNGADNDACDRGCRLPADACVECSTSDECGRSVDRCTRLIDGQFCTPSCSDDGACPPGLSCINVTTAEGGRENQCVPAESVCAGCFDQDGDGYGIGLDCLDVDCNDANGAVNPGAEEICNDIDDDCDGDNDEGCPPDLIVIGETVELSGAHLFDRVDIRDGGRVVVPATESTSCSTDGPNCLTIEARVVFIRAGSGIDASGVSECGEGAGPDAGAGAGLRNVGPAGGSYGGVGGAGAGIIPRPRYGTESGPDIAPGGPGGDFRILQNAHSEDACADLGRAQSFGGSGGGCVQITTPFIDLAGFIRADGAPGQDAPDSSIPTIVDGGAGGSGGGIRIDADQLTTRAGHQLSAAGGRGGRGGRYTPENNNECVGNGGGGGGGGRIKLEGRISGSLQVNVAGGAGANGPQSDTGPGSAGTRVP